MKLFDYEKEHLNKVREGLSECMVLLKKNGQFPLQKAGTIAAYGSGVRHSIKGGTGSGDVNAHVTISIEQGLIEAGFQIISSAWLDHYDTCRADAKKLFRKQLKREAKEAGANLLVYGMGAIMPEPEYELPLDFSADAAIYVLSRISGEGGDRKAVPGDILLTDSEIRDIRLLNEKYEKFMLVLNVGGPVDLTPVKNTGNILLLSQLGSEMGNGLSDVLLGKITPSGKLTTTWTSWEDYCPDIHMGETDDTFYQEGIYVGYRYFDTVDKKPLFPFGHGLSYTDFQIRALSTELDGSRITLSAEVENTGAFPGKEVVQLYVTAPELRLQKPWQELAGFAKTGDLLPGEKEILKISFDLADISSFDETALAYCLEAGEYILRLGTGSQETLAVAVIEIPKEIITARVRSVCSASNVKEKQYARKKCIEDTRGLTRIAVDPECIQTINVEYDIEAETDPAIRELSDEELAYLAVGHFSGKGGLLSFIGNASDQVAGAAGETTSELKQKGIMPIVMADGPAGLRLSKKYYKDKKGLHSLGGGSIPHGILDILSPALRKVLLAFMGGRKAPKDAEVKTQYCTALPIGTAVAQSWNPDYAFLLGDIVGDEMERFGVHLWLAPALNIHRSIRCGRNFEYYSEDPLISGKMAAAFTRGVQSHPGCGTTIKHFAANNQELNRYYNNSQLSERTLREIYLKGFQICIREAQPTAVMTSYNLLNGVHTSESRELTEDYLRAESGFRGVVMTDWVLGLKNLGSKYAMARADRVAAAGGDLFMPGSRKDYDNVLKALKAGTLSRRQVEINATRVLNLTNSLKKMEK